MEKTLNCTNCHKAINLLEVFPTGICVECYAVTPEANAPLTAETLANLFRNAVSK